MNPEGAPRSLGTMPIDEFLDLLASSSPTPGGGGIAALTGALAAGLISMVSSLTIGKEKYASVEEQVKALRAQSEDLRLRLHALIDGDARAYEGVMAAYRLPRATEEEKKARTARIQEAIIEATKVPLDTAVQSAKVVELADPAAKLTNNQALGDVIMAAYLAEAAIRGLVANIEINLRPIKDPEAARPLLEQARALTEGLREKVDRAVAESMARV